MSSTAKKPEEIRAVKCPSCQKAVLWCEASTYRPFCSKRCQLIDFGDWASEKNSIPVEEPFDDLSFDPENYQD